MILKILPIYFQKKKILSRFKETLKKQKIFLLPSIFVNDTKWILEIISTFSKINIKKQCEFSEGNVKENVCS